MARWFGQSWGASVCDPEHHAPTPLGVRCTECRQPINEHDRGMLIPYVTETETIETAYHLRCFLKIMGIRP